MVIIMTWTGLWTSINWKDIFNHTDIESLICLLLKKKVLENDYGLVQLKQDESYCESDSKKATRYGMQ